MSSLFLRMNQIIDLATMKGFFVFYTPISLNSHDHGHMKGITLIVSSS